jgi:hypothetical protein
MKDVITQGMAQEKVMTETDTVLQSMGKSSGQTSQSIGDYADSMARATGISDDLIQHSENVLLTFGNLGKNIFPQAETAALNMSTMLGTDLQGSVIQVGKALNDPIKGITALSRVGVSFSQTEKDTIAVMMKHNNIAGAQAVIMGELNKQFGGAAIAAGTTFGGQMQRLNVTFDQAKEKIGLALIPILRSMLEMIMPIVTNIAGKFIPAMEGLAGKISQVVVPAFAMLTFNFQNGILPAITKIASFVMANVLPALAALGGFIAGNVIPVLMKLAGFILSNVVPVIMTLVMWFVQHVVPILKVLWNVIATQVLPALEGVWKSIASNLLPAIEKLWNKLSPVLIPVLQLLGTVLRNVVGPALGFVIGIIGHLIDLIANIIGLLGNFLGLLGQIKNAVGDALGGVGNTLHSLHIPGFAVGGVVAQGGLIRVGEEGSEVIAVPGGTRVYPHGQEPGGKSFTINMYGTNLGIQDLQRELWRQAVLHG